MKLILVLTATIMAACVVFMLLVVWNIQKRRSLRTSTAITQKTTNGVIKFAVTTNGNAMADNEAMVVTNSGVSER